MIEAARRDTKCSPGHALATYPLRPVIHQPMKTDIKVKTWVDLHERLYEGSWSDKLRRFRSSEAYRGMQVATFDLTTTLVRLGGDYTRHEDDLLRNFRKYAHDHAA